MNAVEFLTPTTLDLAGAKLLMKACRDLLAESTAPGRDDMIRKIDAVLSMDNGGLRNIPQAARARTALVGAQRGMLPKVPAIGIVVDAIYTAFTA